VAEASEAIFRLAKDGVSPPVKIPGGYAIFKLMAVEEARRPPLAEVREEVAQAVRQDKARQAAEDRVRRAAEAWRQGEDPRAVAKREGLAYGELGPFSRAEPLADTEHGPTVGPLALGLAAGAVGGPTATPAGAWVVKVLTREPPDPEGFDRTRSELERELLAQKRAQLWQGWLAGLREGATIEVNRTLLPQP
jgi:peptidyl-prolyl cis-trans isomerase D